MIGRSDEIDVNKSIIATIAAICRNPVAKTVTHHAVLAKMGLFIIRKTPHCFVASPKPICIATIDIEIPWHYRHGTAPYRPVAKAASLLFITPAASRHNAWDVPVFALRICKVAAPLDVCRRVLVGILRKLACNLRIGSPAVLLAMGAIRRYTIREIGLVRAIGHFHKRVEVFVGTLESPDLGKVRMHFTGNSVWPIFNSTYPYIMKSLVCEAWLVNIGSSAGKHKPILLHRATRNDVSRSMRKIEAIDGASIFRPYQFAAKARHVFPFDADCRLATRRNPLVVAYRNDIPALAPA